MPRGGRRPGAGKPKGSKDRRTLEKLAHMALLREMVAKELGPMTEAQIAAAKGFKYLVARDKRGGRFKRIEAQSYKPGQEIGGEEDIVEMWEKDPSPAAYADLLNRAYGKPVDSIEAHHTGKLEIGWKGE